MSEEEKTKKPEIMLDLRGLSSNYFKASESNAVQANNSITHLQSAILTIILAELAFIGITDLSKQNPSILGVISVCVLVISAFLFILGTYKQWKHVLRTSRLYFELAKEVTDFILKTGIEKVKVDELPDVLSDKGVGLDTDNISDKFFICTIIGTLVASILVIIRLIIIIT